MMQSTSQNELEGTVGGSFLDNLLGLINYPPEDDITWYENDTHVEMRWAGRIFRCVKDQRKDSNGLTLEDDDWHELTSNGLILVI